MTYGTANVNVSNLNDDSGDNLIWKLAINDSYANYSYVL